MCSYFKLRALYKMCTTISLKCVFTISVISRGLFAHWGWKVSCFLCWCRKIASRPAWATEWKICLKKTKNECSDSNLRAEYLKHLVESLFFGVLPHPVTQYDVESTGPREQSGLDMDLLSVFLFVWFVLFLKPMLASNLWCSDLHFSGLVHHCWGVLH